MGWKELPSLTARHLYSVHRRLLSPLLILHSRMMCYSAANYRRKYAPLCKKMLTYAFRSFPCFRFTRAAFCPLASDHHGRENAELALFLPLLSVSLSCHSHTFFNSNTHNPPLPLLLLPMNLPLFLLLPHPVVLMRSILETSTRSSDFDTSVVSLSTRRIFDTLI